MFIILFLLYKCSTCPKISERRYTYYSSMETFYTIKIHFLQMRRHYDIDNTDQRLKFLRCAVKSLSRLSRMVLRSSVVGIVAHAPFIMVRIIYPKLFGQGLSPYRLFVTMASFTLTTCDP